MNPLEIECLIEKVIAKRNPMASERYNLAIFNGELLCLGSRSPRVIDCHVATFTEIQIVNGFTNSQWDNMTKIILAYIERKTGCLKNQIH